MLMSSWMLFSKQEGEITLENELDASNFLYNDSIYSSEFRDILEKITLCYYLLRKDKIVVPLNDENGIRDILVNKYLNNSKIKRIIKLEYFILPEVPETTSLGRTDIRVFSPNTFYNQNEYYLIECKRLGRKAQRGSSGLNYKYIANGIQRFTSGFYSSFYKVNGMIGFIVESIDITKNVGNINYLLENNFGSIKTVSFLTQEHFIQNFEFHFSSVHKTEDGFPLRLYHLMFNFI